MLGIEVAGSGYYGNRSPTSYSPLSIFAIDWTLQKGPFELIGEAAWAYAQKYTFEPFLEVRLEASRQVRC